MAKKNKSWDSHDFLEKEYEIKEKSTSQIAKEQGTYPMTIRRALKKHGFKIRDKSQAQKNNLEKNGSPLQGRARTREEKLRISMGLQEHWEKMTAEEKIAAKLIRSQIGKSAWDKKTDSEKKNAVNKMRIGNSKKGRKGSKNENAVADMLLNYGFKIIQRSKDFTPGRRFEIDIALVKERIAIEWDGPNHFDPIYGEESLASVKAKDKIKNYALVKSGWTVLRVRDHSTSSTMAFCRRACDKIINTIENGDKNIVHVIDAE
jgi:very-short-patch-repair endonuclease